MRLMLLVSGKVQGVGFRNAAKQYADINDITGWVQNQDDGTVKLEVQGKEQVVNKFIEKMKEGFNSFIRVNDVQIIHQDEEVSYNNFKIK
ncbi:acylphosphatase [Virgibacillus halodenitrificans]|uniref:Acylphosphatase n=1 Tax=Virgibacillus halodenitrificans TaxID=1482 RepID=A0AAC9J0Q9_VIRHA|nr:acylphosphatase [Virgibacillus halodenitrificans]APC48498.1 acylphosphatase [Virgibacillus halodenitrificans]MCG1028371.1 acylphosphatase [Virgibacillus halodenitrificans]MCJ0931072.1 acylphosphatase [Virgibacillus halodenitrificans]MEC2160460.1 acylphosphatase [Virgibacillus halodenitrificans]MYL45327.1 acylphosphatase [Virgibacillus halodenitrificans]